MLHVLTLPTPFPVGPVNAYLAEGEPLTLIDTGPKDDATRAALEAALQAHGHRLEDIQRLILTHHHVDHVGLAGEITARSGAEVLTHPYNLPWLSDYTAERERHAPFFRAVYTDGGVPEDIVRLMDASGENMGRWSDPVPAARPLVEGDTLWMDGANWKVFHTPGHAGGLICLWEPFTRTLQANDHFIRDISSNPVLEPPPTMNGPRPRRLVEYLKHMQRMAALEPVVALPGHGEPVTDVPGLVRQRLAFHQRRAQKIYQTLAEQPLTLWELTRPIFPRLRHGMDYFLGLSEILGHLDLLEEEGRARPVRHGAVVRWAQTRPEAYAAGAHAA
jgi:glyoxylase-like metal-dependent hydrolase (beta-lactamase superfamily II)